MTLENLKLLASIGAFLENARYGDVDLEEAGELQDQIGDLYLQEQDLMNVKKQIDRDYNRTGAPQE